MFSFFQNLPFASECEFKPNANNNSPALLPGGFFLPQGTDLSQPPPGYKGPYDPHQQEDGTVGSEVEFVEPNDNGDVEVIAVFH